MACLTDLLIQKSSRAHSKMARPTKYNDAKAAQITTLLRGGCTRKDAAGSVGISSDTLVRWSRSNADFAALVESAEAYAAVKMTTIVTAAAATEWRAALEWLKRRRREEWGDSADITSGGETIKAYIGFDTENV